MAREFQPERGRFGMDAVASADAGRKFVLDGARLQRRHHPLAAGDKQITRARQLHRQARVEHIRGSHALVEEARLREGGGRDKIEKQHSQGKLTARERIELLLDEDSYFEEIGLLVLLGVAPTDSVDQVRWMADKIVGLRLFADEDGKMNRDVRE